MTNAGVQGGKYGCQKCDCDRYREATDPAAAKVRRKKRGLRSGTFGRERPARVQAADPGNVCPRCGGRLLREASVELDAPDDHTCLQCGYTHYPPGYREAALEMKANELTAGFGHRRRQPSYGGVKL